MGDSNSARFWLSSFLISLLSVICASFRRFMIRVLAVGPIPNHIAIIMDGNRRFADRSGMERSRGHVLGYEQLINTLENCLELGVKYVSVYAFSIDNFARPQDEVSSLMSLMEEKLDHLVQRDSLLKDFGVRVQVLGDLTLLPVNVRVAAERAMAATKQYRSVVLNLCVAYTSTAEIVHSIQEMRDEILMTARKTTPCAPRPVNGQLHSKSTEWRATNGPNHERKVPPNGAFPHEHWNGDVHLSDRAFNLEILGKQNADAALVPALSDLSISESRNGAICPDAVELNAVQLANGKTRTEFQSRLATECSCADNLVCCTRASEGLENPDISTEPCPLLESISEQEIESHLYTAGCPPPDILIRTSGETRLSNFMLWQCSSFSRLAFCNVLWPEFSLRHLAWIILDYQRAFPDLQKQQRLQEHLLDSKDL